MSMSVTVVIGYTWTTDVLSRVDQTQEYLIELNVNLTHIIKNRGIYTVYYQRKYKTTNNLITISIKPDVIEYLHYSSIPNVLFLTNVILITIKVKNKCGRLAISGVLMTSVNVCRCSYQ